MGSESGLVLNSERLQRTWCSFHRERKFPIQINVKYGIFNTRGRAGAVPAAPLQELCREGWFSRLQLRGEAIALRRCRCSTDFLHRETCLRLRLHTTHVLGLSKVICEFLTNCKYY